MKSVIIGLALVAASLSVNAADVRDTGVLHQPYFSRMPPKQPLCGPEQVLVPIYGDGGVIVNWICVGPQWP
jgi:hypothetical protein